MIIVIFICDSDKGYRVSWTRLLVQISGNLLWDGAKSAAVTC